MNKAESDRWARHPYDPPPARGSGPEYHAEYQYWLDRHPQEKFMAEYGRVGSSADYATEKNPTAKGVTDVKQPLDAPAPEPGSLTFRVTLLATAAQLTELEKVYEIKDVALARPNMR